MPTPILTTKLYIPPVRPDPSTGFTDPAGSTGGTSLVPRPRLIERLNEGLRLGRKLTLVSAPAGFGKTTLLSEWIQYGVGSREYGVGGGHAPAGETSPTPNSLFPNPKFAWLSLDENDNDLTRFLTYFIAALQTIEANTAQGVLSALHAAQPQAPPTEAILTALINEVAAIPDRPAAGSGQGPAAGSGQGTVLVLDDYHLIEAQPIHDALTFLLEHLPPPERGLHLVIATREDPHLPLARLRARGQLTELRAADLRFTSSEAAAFLNRVMGLDLSADDVAALETRTEGWIAGLQLAALALQGTMSMQGYKDVAGVIQSFTGSHRFVLDYLVEEVLEQQSESVQAFLLQTSILDRLTGSLCDAVCSAGTASSSFGTALTGPDDGQATLEMLERANLFIIPLDGERRWYRYHHLFAELLQQRLEFNHPTAINDLHAKAVIWYETNGDLSGAIHHALAMDDVQTATRLIEKGALEALRQSELRFILKWVDRLPEPALESSPSLFIYHAWALVLTGQVKSLGSRLEQTAWLLDAIEENDETQKKEMLGYIAGLKAVLALWQRDFASGRDFARQALENLPDDNWIRGYCAIVVGSSFSGNGDLDAAREAYAESYSVGKAAGNKLLAVSGACNLAYIVELGGHLQQAKNLFQGSFQLAEQEGQELPVAGYIHVDLARVLYELNDLDAASQHLKEGIELCRRLADGRAEKIGHCLLARVQLAQGQDADVLDSIQKAKGADPSPGISFDLRGGEYPQIRLWLKQKRFADLEAWLKESGANIDDVSHFKGQLNRTMHARVLIALGQEHPDSTTLSDALKLLEELLERADKNGWGSKVIEILALQALAYQAGGDTGRAMTALERALTLAEPEGYIRTFVDEGPPMARLLGQLYRKGVAVDYIAQILAAFGTTDDGPQTTQTTLDVSSVVGRPSSALVEPLSEREIEVLQLIAEGLTNREIAARLYLSLNTVKVHTRNIYGKLGVNNRTQAAARASALGVLPPFPSQQSHD